MANCGLRSTRTSERRRRGRMERKRGEERCRLHRFHVYGLPVCTREVAGAVVLSYLLGGVLLLPKVDGRARFWEWRVGRFGFFVCSCRLSVCLFPLFQAKEAFAFPSAVSFAGALFRFGAVCRRSGSFLPVCASFKALSIGKKGILFGRALLVIYRCFLLSFLLGKWLYKFPLWRSFRTFLVYFFPVVCRVRVP